MRPSPIRAEYHRWVIAKNASNKAAPTANIAKNQIRPRLSDGIASSMIARKTKGGTRPTAEAKIIDSKKPIIAVLYGLAKTHTRAIDVRSIFRPLTASESPGIIM